MSSHTIPPNSIYLLHRWRVMEAVSPDGVHTRHVCGEDAASRFGISTSAIQEFDPKAMAVKTRSGKIYNLIGQPDSSPLGEAAWHKWCNDNGIIGEQDVTSDFLKTDQTPTVTFKQLGGRPMLL